MKSELPNRDGHEPLPTLRSVRRIQPDPQATHRALQRAIAAVQPQPHHSPNLTWKGIIMRTGLAAAIITLLVTTAWLATNGPDVLAAPTWADITRQTAGIDQVYIDARVYQGTKMTQRADVWIKSPGFIRGRQYELVDGQFLPADCSIATPTAAVRWNERTKLGEHTSTSNRYMMQSASARHMEAVLGVSLLADRANPDIKINGELVRFEPVASKHPEDAALRGFKLKNKSPAAAELPPPFNALIYWFSARFNTLCRVTMTMGEGADAQRSDMIVDFNPTVPAGWFDVKLPADCIDVAVGIVPRLSPEVRNVYDQVAAARKRFGDYRAVIWRDRTGGWPSFREATLGNQWRCDNIDWVTIDGAFDNGNKQAYIKVTPDDPFDKLWHEVNRPDYILDMTAMTWQGQFAVLHYSLAGRGPRTSAQLYQALEHGYEKFFGPSFHMLAWPEWVWWENLQPHGLDLREPPLKWRLGHANPDHPDRVEVIGERKSNLFTSARYVFDRSKDWVCVRQEWNRGGGDKLIWDVTDFARTPDGLWYPRRANFGSSKYDYAVQRGSADPHFFEYPKNMPQPTDPFAQMQSQADQAANPGRDVPATAKGKYTATAARGLPRGFDDKAKSEAHWDMQRNMTHIAYTLDRCAHKHDWIFPESLQALVDEGFLKPEDLKNPLHPAANPPFGYIRPNMKLPNRLERMVLHEPFDEWPGVITVVFQDGSVEYIHDKAQFDKLLREATAPTPPSRPE